jgi:hypothetical protein
MEMKEFLVHIHITEHKITPITRNLKEYERIQNAQKVHRLFKTQAMIGLPIGSNTEHSFGGAI